MVNSRGGVRSLLMTSGSKGVLMVSLNYKLLWVTKWSGDAGK